MENFYKKEKSSKHHMKIDVGQTQAQDDVFTLANPMTYGDVTTPTSPPTQSSSRSGHHTVSNPATPTNPTHSTGFSRTFERLSLKSKNKNQSFFKFFGRSHEKTSGGGVAERNGGAMPDRNVGVSRKRASMANDEEYGEGSSGSDHDDPFSPHSSASIGDVTKVARQLSEPPKSPSSGIEVYATLPRQTRRHNSGGVAGGVVTGHHSRDSGFSSERESVSHVRITPQTSLNTEDDRGSPSEDVDYQPAGMEALEILHSQLQLLVKRDTDEDTDSVDIYEQIINQLSSQLEEQAVAMDTLRQTESNLRLSLRLAEQRALEAETEKAWLQERYVKVTGQYQRLAVKYKSLKASDESSPLHTHGSKSLPHNVSPRHGMTQCPVPAHQPHLLAHQPHLPSATANGAANDRTPPQRVQSQTLFDRKQKPVDSSPAPFNRPSTAQGFHDQGNDSSSKTSIVSPPSLSHIETCV